MRIVAMICCALVLAAGAEAQLERGPEVRSVRVVGAADIGGAGLKGSVLTRATECRSPLFALGCMLGMEGSLRRRYLSEPLLRQDEQRLAGLHSRAGYPGVRVAAEVTNLPRGGVEVRFLVWPGEPLVLRSLEIHGLDELPATPSMPPLPLRAGERLTLAGIEAAQRTIAGRLAADGHAFAQVGVESRIPPDGGPVDLVLQVWPGPVTVFGATSVHAEYPLQERDVRRFLAFAPGERFSTAHLERTIERLYRLPAVERVQVQPAPAEDGENVVATQIFVVAAEPRGLQLEGAISSYSCVEGIVGWTNRYFLGGPRAVSVSAGASNLFTEPLRSFPCTGVGEEEFARPDFFVRGDFSQSLGPDTWLNLGGGYSRESSPRAYVRTGVIARASIVHELRRGLDLTAGYSPERRDNSVAGPLVCALYGTCGGDELLSLTRMTTMAPVEIGLDFGPPRARRIDPGSPLTAAWTYPPLPGWTHAGRISLTAAGRPTLSEVEFTRLVLEGSVTRYPGRVFQLAGRARGGILSGGADLPPQVRFFGGGPFGVRGVGANLLGPKALTVSRARVAELGCDPSPGGCAGVVVDPRVVRIRPLGGRSLAELSLEARMWASPSLQLAVFTDFGIVHAAPEPDSPAEGLRTESVHTPGAGILALTPLGPVRVDLAYDPSPVRRYPLLTRDEQGSAHVHLGEVVYDPIGYDDPSSWERLTRRLRFQLSMRQPF